MVDLIYKISGDAAERKNRRPALILSLNTTTVTPNSKFNIQLHSPRDTDCELPIPSELQNILYYCYTLNECVSWLLSTLRSLLSNLILLWDCLIFWRTSWIWRTLLQWVWNIFNIIFVLKIYLKLQLFRLCHLLSRAQCKCYEIESETEVKQPSMAMLCYWTDSSCYQGLWKLKLKPLASLYLVDELSQIEPAEMREFCCCFGRSRAHARTYWWPEIGAYLAAKQPRAQRA